MNTFLNAEELKKKTPIFLHCWKEKIDVIGDFENIYMKGDEYRAEKAPYANAEYWQELKDKMTHAIDRYKDINILFASYGQDNYSGDAWVLFERDGMLYEVSGSHCSCYGLEGQWDESIVVLDELKNRLAGEYFGKDSYSDNEFAKELIEFLSTPITA